MIYQLLISKKALKEISNLSLKDKQRINLTFEKIKKDPFIGKKLVGELKGLYSVRVWPFRILYEVQNKKLLVFVLKAAHRKEVYK